MRVRKPKYGDVNKQLYAPLTWRLILVLTWLNVQKATPTTINHQHHCNHQHYIIVHEYPSLTHYRNDCKYSLNGTMHHSCGARTFCNCDPANWPCPDVDLYDVVHRLLAEHLDIVGKCGTEQCAADGVGWTGIVDDCQLGTYSGEWM